MDPGEFFRIRIDLSLTQEDLAERMGVTRQTVNRWENGKLRISTRTANQLRAIEREG